MRDVELNLIVIRSSDLVRANEFYAAFGLEFSRERHGTGPEHLATQIGSTVFEIYPIGSGEGTAKVRLGFRVDSIASLIPRLQQAGGAIISPPHATEWGLRAVVADNDGHRIELTQHEIEA